MFESIIQVYRDYSIGNGIWAKSDYWQNPVMGHTYLARLSGSIIASHMTRYF